jgi:carboxyl-terminal processing protease
LSTAFCLAAATDENRFTEAARALDETITENYAYLDKLPGGALPQSMELRAKRDAVQDSRSLLAYAEERIASLADHHAITGSSFRNSWAIVPTYADIWVVTQNGKFVIDAVREKSPAAAAQIKAGDRVVSVDGVSVRQAVAGFWEAMGLQVTPARADYAARVLLTGRRDRPRRLAIQSALGEVRELTLSSLYDQEQEQRPPVTVCSVDEQVVVRFNNSLGENATIPAFDNAIRDIPKASDLILDLRDTPSGGNTTVARAIMGWFVTKPHNYQIHNRPAEERETGIPRQWIEQVLPREGLHRANLPTILVGRWTGSMGEGLATGFASMGADVQGTVMAGLNGSIEDLRIGETDLFVKLPTERLLTVEGRPREDFVPGPITSERSVPGTC